MKKQTPQPISTAEFDARFDAGEDIGDYLNPASAKSPTHLPQRVNVDMPRWVVAALDTEASRRGVSRQALIKFWLVEKLEPFSS